jgi:hypothetical protein
VDKQRLDLAAQPGVGPAELLQKSRAGRRRLPASFEEELANALIFDSRHGRRLP